MEEKLKLTEVIIAGLGVFLALAAGTVAYLDYRDRAQLQSMRALHEAQLSLCEEVSGASASLVAAKNQLELDEKIDALSKLKHGKALALLDKQVLDAMVTLYNETVRFTPSDETADFRLQLRCSIGDAAFSVVHECRRMHSHAFEREAGGNLALLDPTYTMGWASSGCPE